MKFMINYITALLVPMMSASRDDLIFKVEMDNDEICFKSLLDTSNVTDYKFPLNERI